MSPRPFRTVVALGFRAVWPDALTPSRVQAILLAIVPDRPTWASGPSQRVPVDCEVEGRVLAVPAELAGVDEQLHPDEPLTGMDVLGKS